MIEYVELSKPSMDHILDDLPMGRYIVCGEALHNAKLLQASCFEARVERLDNNCENIENILTLRDSSNLIFFYFQPYKLG